MKVYVLERVEGDGKEVSGYSFHSVHGTRASAERAQHAEQAEQGHGPFRMRPVPLYDADRAIQSRNDDP